MNKYFPTLLLVPICFFFFSHHCFAEPQENPCPQVLTLEKATEIAVDFNPLARIAREGIVISWESVGIAYSPYYPQIDFRASYRRWKSHIFLPGGLLTQFPILISSTVGPVDEFVINVRGRYSLYDGGERCADLTAAYANYYIAKEEAERTRQNILLSVYEAYFTYLADTEANYYAHQNLFNAQNHRRIASDRYKAGAVPLADVIRTEVEVSEAQLNVIRTESMMRISKGNLNVAMGIPPEVCYEIDPHPDCFTDISNIDVCKATEVALQYRPEINQAYQRITVAQAGVDRARSASRPHVFAEGFYGKKDEIFFPEDPDWSIGVFIEMPIFTGFRLTHELYRARGEERREFASYDNVTLNVQQEVWNSYSRLLEASQLIQTSRVQIRFAKENLRIAEERYRTGAGTINDLTDAQTALAQSGSNYTDAYWNYYISQAFLKRSMGILGICFDCSRKIDY
jgi:outer membrane protein TolC